MPKLLIFDLDNTLAESKQAITKEMAKLLAKLLDYIKVGVISGGGLPQFLKQVVDQLPHKANLANLYLLPTAGAALYEWNKDKWNKVYEERLSDTEVHTIERAMREGAEETGFIDFKTKVWGERIEHRGGSMVLSALGQQAPPEEKKAWDPDHTKRRALQQAISVRLPEFSVAMGGWTTIDVTKKNIDKAYGVHQLCERVHIDEIHAVYVGDQLVPGGNDEAVYKTRVKTHAVKDPTDTEAYLKEMLAGTPDERTS